MRGFFPPGTVLLSPENAPGGGLPTFGPVINRTLKALEGTNTVWLDLDTGRTLADVVDSNATAGTDEDKLARQWRVKNGVDVAARLDGSNSGLVGVDMAAMRVGDVQWDAATPLGITGAMSASMPEGHIGMIESGYTPATFLFKTREGGMGILQITGLNPNLSGLDIRYKLVQSASNGDAPKTDAPKPAVHANFQARLDAAASITDFTDRDAALGGLAIEAARGGDATIAKLALGRITDFTSRDSAAAATAREFLVQGHRASALDAATTMVDFTARDGNLAEVARDAAKAGDGEITKRALGRITDFTTRDNAAVESARLLMKAGSGQDALAVARSITDFSRRDQALAELAEIRLRPAAPPIPHFAKYFRKSSYASRMPVSMLIFGRQPSANNRELSMILRGVPSGFEVSQKILPG